MDKEVVEMQMTYMMFQEPLDIEESLFVQEAQDWRQPYLDFLLHRLLPSNRSDEMRISPQSSLLKKACCF